MRQQNEEKRVTKLRGKQFEHTLFYSLFFSCYFMEIKGISEQISNYDLLLV